MRPWTLTAVVQTEEKERAREWKTCTKGVNAWMRLHANHKSKSTSDENERTAACPWTWEREMSRSFVVSVSHHQIHAFPLSSSVRSSSAWSRCCPALDRSIPKASPANHDKTLIGLSFEWGGERKVKRLTRRKLRRRRRRRKSWTNYRFHKLCVIMYRLSSRQKTPSAISNEWHRDSCASGIFFDTFTK